MTRKDIIIVSLLINAGVLALLFMLALNHDDTIGEQGEITHAMVDTHQAAPTPLANSSLSSSPQPPEMEDLLSSFASDELDTPLALDEEGYIQLEPQPARIKEPDPAHTSNIAEAEQLFVEVKVKKGDALEKIARHNGTSIEALKEANHLTSNKLSIGQILRVPVNSKTREIAYIGANQNSAAGGGSEASAAKNSVQNDEVQYHIVKSGDSPWKIAKQYGVNVDDLLKLNEMSESRAKNLKIGEKLRVR